MNAMRLVSILGDSISTYEGYNPEGYSVYYDKEMQELNQLHSVYDTWWARVNQALRAFLCVNNSYSGSMVCGKAFPAGGSDERLRNLRTSEYTPDYILIYLGFNDFGNGIKVHRTDKRSDQYHESDCFEEAYDNMIKTIRSLYPDAAIICGTLMRTKLKGRNDWIFPEKFAGVELEEYNEAIRAITQKNHCYLADLAIAGESYETLDGSHPTAQGHAAIACAWIKCLDELCSGEGRSAAAERGPLSGKPEKL